jgi:hypothetical protein
MNPRRLRRDRGELQVSHFMGASLTMYYRQFTCKKILDLVRISELPLTGSARVGRSLMGRSVSGDGTHDGLQEGRQLVTPSIARLRRERARKQIEHSFPLATNCAMLPKDLELFPLVESRRARIDTMNPLRNTKRLTETTVKPFLFLVNRPCVPPQAFPTASLCSNLNYCPLDFMGRSSAAKERPVSSCMPSWVPQAAPDTSAATETAPGCRQCESTFIQAVPAGGDGTVRVRIPAAGASRGSGSGSDVVT